MTAREFRAWELYNELEPFGEERQDYRVASILHMLYHINRGKTSPTKELKEFVLKFGETVEERKQTPQQQFAMLKVLAAMHSNDAAVPVPDTTPTSVTFSNPTDQAAFDAELEKARKAMN